MRNSLCLALLLVTTATGQVANTGGRVNSAGLPNTPNILTNMGMPGEVGGPRGMTLERAQLAPTIEDMCMQASMRPAMTKGGLSDIVGGEVAKRAKFLRSFPQMAGTGKWGCAASFYAARNPPSELGNLFGDLIDTTGCMDFTCDPFQGPKPINRFMNALLMGSMLGGMNAGPSMGLFSPQPAPSLTGDIGQSNVPSANPGVSGQPSVPIAPAASKPAVPASPPSAFNPPVNQPPQFTNQGANQQMPNQQMPNQPATNQASYNQLSQALMDPRFQEQLMLMLTSMLGNTGTVAG